MKDDTWEVFANRRDGVVTILPPMVGCAGSQLLGLAGSLTEAREYAQRVAEARGYVVNEPWKEAVACPR